MMKMAIWLHQVRVMAALITAQYPVALYLHCASYCLILAVIKSLQVTRVCNMMGVVDSMYVFFVLHPKTSNCFGKINGRNETRVICYKVEGSLLHKVDPAQ